MGLFNFFKKKEKEQEEPLAHFYGVIVTNIPLEVNPYYVRSFEYSIKDNLFANLPYIFLNFSLVREYIKGRLLKQGGYGKLYIYHIDFVPLNKEDEEKIKNICDDKTNLVDVSEYSGFDIAVLDDYTIVDSIDKIMPGIETMDEFYHCLSVGYDKFLNTYLKSKYYERFSESKELEPIIRTALNMFKLDFIIDLFDTYYKKDDDWEEEFKTEFAKIIIDMNKLKDK